MIINPFDNEQEFTSSDKLITHLTQLAVDKNNVFRGYGKQSELFPNIIREKDWREQEIRLLHEFERYGLQYFSANNPIDFMSYAQHYGLPTRLLDFTYNPFIALYFSLFTPKGTNYTYEEDRIYYYMRYCSLNDQIHIRTLPYFDETLFQSASFAVQSNRMIYLLNRIIRGLKEEADEHDTGVKAIVNDFARIYYDDHPSKSVESLTENPNFKSFLDDEITKFEQKRVLFVDANQCNQRIVMQQGLFMFPYTLDIKEHSHILKSNTVVIKIHKRIRDDLLDYLDTIGINAFRLMPDLQNVCYAVKRKVIDERQAESPLFKKKTSVRAANIEELHPFLKEAFDRYKKPNGYANIAPVGAFLKQSLPDFDIHAYGFSKLYDLIASFPDKYEIKKDDKNHAVPVALYRCK